MTDIVVVGSGTKQAKKTAQKDYPNLDYTYVSLADYDLNSFVSKLYYADRVIYNNFWESGEHKDLTEFVLLRLITIFDIEIENFSLLCIDKKLFNSNAFQHTVLSQLFQGFLCMQQWNITNFLGYTDYRTSLEPHLYSVGDSYAYGARLIDRDQRYAKLLEKKLQLPLVELAAPGTSIEWAADQILRSDIRTGDTLIWTTTHINRMTWVVENTEMQVFSNWRMRYGNNADAMAAEKYIDYIMTNDPHRLTVAMKAVAQIVSFCQKLKINLAICNTDLNNSKEFLKFLSSTKKFLQLPDKVDKSDDWGHPGPLTHQAWADFLEPLLDNRKKK
jgi:hypothetical protein